MRPTRRPGARPPYSGRAWTDHDVRNWRRRVWKGAIKACELDPAIVPYDLRHSFASLLIHEKRLSIVEIADQMGHAPTMTSDTYGHVMRELREAEPVSAEDQIRRALLLGARGRFRLLAAGAASAEPGTLIRMRRARLLVALLWLLLAAAVPDDGRAWSEVALRSSPSDEVATCLRDGDAGGLLQLLGPLERRSSPMDVVRVSDGAIDLVGRVALGISYSCPEIAAGEQGTVVVAGQVRARGLRVTVADPGGPFSAPRTLGAAVIPSPTSMSPSPRAALPWWRGRKSFRAGPPPTH